MHKWQVAQQAARSALDREVEGSNPSLPAIAEVLQNMPELSGFAVPPMSEGWRQLPPVQREQPLIDGSFLSEVEDRIADYLVITAKFEQWRYLHSAWHGKFDSPFATV